MKDTQKTNLNCSSKRVGMSFHKLLISDGLRVCCTGDLYKISIILLYFFFLTGLKYFGELIL